MVHSVQRTQAPEWQRNRCPSISRQGMCFQRSVKTTRFRIRGVTVLTWDRKASLSSGDWHLAPFEPSSGAIQLTAWGFRGRRKSQLSFICCPISVGRWAV